MVRDSNCFEDESREGKTKAWCVVWSFFCTDNLFALVTKYTTVANDLLTSKSDGWERGKQETGRRGKVFTLSVSINQNQDSWIISPLSDQA